LTEKDALGTYKFTDGKKPAFFEDSITKHLIYFCQESKERRSAETIRLKVLWGG
jgi:hypothetical protein